MYPYNYQQSILPGGGYHCVSDILVDIELKFKGNIDRLILYIYVLKLSYATYAYWKILVFQYLFNDILLKINF